MGDGEQDRMRLAFNGLVELVPGPRPHGKDTEVLLEPFLDEMLELGRGHADADGTPFKVYDGYFEKWHDVFRVFLVLCHCDTVARNDLGEFAPVAARRNDFKSLWESTRGPNNRGMYPLGYAWPIGQSYLPEGEKIYANSPTTWLTWEDHRELVRLTVEEGIDPMRTGRYKAGPLERLPYFNPMNGYALPFMHLMCYGVVKKFVNMLRHKYTDARDTCYFSEAQRSQLQANGKELACTQDMHRGYLDVVQYAGICRICARVAKEHESSMKVGGVLPYTCRGVSSSV